MRIAAVIAGLLGGLAWIAAYLLDRGAWSELVDPLTWAGLVLLGLATLGAGAGLVSRSAPWLRGLVAICFTLLAGSLLAVLHDAGDDRTLDALVGLVAMVVSIGVLARRPARPAASARRPGGSHAR